jgi:glycosyltransferase involved in cell wall biosynthesis
LDRPNSDRPRLALVAPAFQAYPGEPFVPYWGDLVAELVRHADVTVFPLRFPAGSVPYDFCGARVIPLAYGHVRLRHSPKLWSAAVRAITGAHREVGHGGADGGAPPGGDLVRSRGGSGFDIIQALHGNEAGFVAALAARRLRLPLAVHLGGGELAGLADIGYGSQLYPWERAHVAVALHSARLITTGSHVMTVRARAFVGWRRAARVRWAPLGIDPARFPMAPLPELSRLLHVGELNPVKDQATLLRAFAKVLETHPAVNLDLVGGGPQLAHLRRMARELGVASRIQWWGQIPPAAIPYAFDQSSAFVLASRHEGQGMVLAEAAAAGLPIASTRVGMAADLPTAGVRLAAPGDVPGLAQAMREALDLAADPVALAPAREVLRAAVERDYNVRACVARWLELYAGLYTGLGSMPPARCGE